MPSSVVRVRSLSSVIRVRDRHMKHRIVVFGVCAAAVVTLGAQQPAPPQASPASQTPAPSQTPQNQTPPPTFRLEVNYVEVDAIVTDAAGNPVSDLTAGDFEVLEDGKPQKISAFSLVNIPIQRADRPLFSPSAIEPDVQSNRQVDGRVYLIVVDDLHINPLRSARAKAAARRFLERYFAANDIAAIVYTSGRSDAGQEFTSNRRLLLAAVDRFVGRKMRSSTLERLEQYRNTQGMRQPGERVDDPTLTERAFHDRNALESIRNLADFMAGIHGRRKAMVLFSEGIDYDINDVFTNRDASTIIDASRDAIGAATRANVAIYSVDPRGLTSLGDEGIEVDSFPTDDPDAGISSADMMSELRLSQDSLRSLSGETGGFAAVNRNDFETAFERIVRDNSTYYVLGYYPANDRRDGRFRKIEVRVKRPGVQVRSRKGYQAPRGKAPDSKTAGAPANAPVAMRDAMNSPLPISGIGMTVFAAPFKGNAPNAAVAIAVELAPNAFTGESAAGELQIGMTALDPKGKMVPGDVIKLPLKADAAARINERGFRAISQMELPPGRYQLRIAATEPGGNMGSVLYDLEVPDFYKAPFTMSGVAITSNGVGRMPTGRSKDPLRDFLPGPPTATRTFSREEELAVFAEFYENSPGVPDHKLDITTTLRSEDGRAVFQNQEERSSAELQGRRGGYGYAMRLPLKDFAPGTYVLRVEAKPRNMPDKGAGRDVQITVR
jgi:VWFA-related protein